MEPEDRENGFYWVSQATLDPKIAEWHGVGWFVTGAPGLVPDGDMVVLSERLEPPRQK